MAMIDDATVDGRLTQVAPQHPLVQALKGKILDVTSSSSREVGSAGRAGRDTASMAIMIHISGALKVIRNKKCLSVAPSS